MNTPQSHSQPHPFTRRAIAAQVLTLAWPVVVEQLLTTTVKLVNVYIVGHLGAAGLAAVGLSMQLINLLIAVFTAVGVGSTALVARHIGAGERREAIQVAGQALLIAILVGVLLALPCLTAGGAMINLLGGAPEVAALGSRYLTAVGFTVPLMSLLYVGNATLRGAGDTRTPMLIMGLVNVVSVAFSWGLANGVGPLPALGVLGAGVGFAIGTGVGGLLVTLILLRGRAVIGLRGHPAALRVHPQQILRLVNVGLPCAVEQTTLRISQLILAAVVTQLGTATYAGHQLGIQILSVAFMPGLAFSIAATTLVGQELGRKNPQRAEACVYTTLWMASFVMGLVGLILFLFAEPLLGVFTSEPDVIAQGVQAVRGCAIIDIPLGWYFVLSGGLRGAGDTRFVLLAQSAPIWLVRMPLAYRLGLSLGWGLPGVWFGMILDMSARGMLLMLRLRSGAWKRIQV